MDNKLIFNNKRLIPINRPDIPSLKFGDYKANEFSINLFEKGIKEYLGLEGNFIMTSSGKMSIYLLFKALELKGTVISSPLSCTMAFAPAIPHGVKFKFIDINPENFVLDIDEVEKNIDENTSAIYVVHLGGVSGDMFRLRQLADKHNILLIEDCAQAFGSEYKFKKLGSYGHIACFSFAKNMWLAGGGGIHAYDKNLIDKIRNFQNTLDESPDGLIKYRFERDFMESQRIINEKVDEEYYNKFLKPSKNANVGIDYYSYFEKADVKTKPSLLQAEILLKQLINLKENNHKRTENAKIIKEALKEVLIFQDFSNGVSSYSKLYCRFKNGLNSQKAILLLMEKGIDAKHLTKSHGFHYQERFDKNNNFKNFDFSASLKNYFKIHDEIVALPISSKMSKIEINYIIEIIKKVYE